MNSSATSIIADQLNKMSSKNSDSSRSPSGTDKLQKCTQTNFSCSCSSFSPNKSPCSSNSQPRPSPSTHVTYTSLPPYKTPPHVSAPPPRTAIHWHTAPSSHSIIPIPTSSLRHIGPTDPVPSSPPQSHPLSITPFRSSPPATNPAPSSSRPRRIPPTRSFALLLPHLIAHLTILTHVLLPPSDLLLTAALPVTNTPF